MKAFFKEIWSFLCPCCQRRISRTFLYFSRISIICPQCSRRIGVDNCYTLIFVIAAGFGIYRLLMRTIYACRRLYFIRFLTLAAYNAREEERFWRKSIVFKSKFPSTACLPGSRNKMGCISATLVRINRMFSGPLPSVVHAGETF